MNGENSENGREFGLKLKCWGMALSFMVVAGGMVGDLRAQSIRELATDRPDATESPVTVDEGWFQVEASMMSYSRDRSGGMLSESWSLGEMNIKYGVTDSDDIQVIVTPYVLEQTSGAGQSSDNDGVGDVTVRWKHNILGNDEGDIAFGLLPFVNVPVRSDVSNDHWEAGLVTPYSWTIDDRWSFGAQLEVGRMYNAADDRLDWSLSHTAVVGVAVTERLGFYFEYLGVSGDHPYEAYFSHGATFSLRKDIQLDAGTLIGLNDAAQDLTLFTGFSWKF